MANLFKLDLSQVRVWISSCNQGTGGRSWVFRAYVYGFVTLAG